MATSTLIVAEVRHHVDGSEVMCLLRAGPAGRMPRIFQSHRASRPTSSEAAARLGDELLGQALRAALLDAGAGEVPVTGSPGDEIALKPVKLSLEGGWGR